MSNQKKIKFRKISIQDNLSDIEDSHSDHDQLHIVDPIFLVPHDSHHSSHHEHDSHHPIDLIAHDSHDHSLIPLHTNRSIDTYRHIRPLSPTPVDSMTRDSHSIIQPLKGTSYMFLNHPTQSFTSKQLCDYIEMIVLHHIKKHETHHHTNTNLQ
eukprot:822393_1